MMNRMKWVLKNYWNMSKDQLLFMCKMVIHQFQDFIKLNYANNPLCDGIYSQLREVYVNDVNMIEMIHDLYMRLDHKLSYDIELAKNMQDSEEK